MAEKSELTKLIERWLSERPTRNINGLARLCGVSYSSVRRAAQGEGVPTQNVVASIASAILNKDELRDFLSKNYPSLIKAIVDVKRGNQDADLTSFVQSPEHFKVLVLASSKDGTNDDEVVRKFGEKALSHFNDLKNSGELISRNGNWICEKDVGLVSLDLARKLLATMALECNSEHDSLAFASYAYVGWESLNKKAAMDLYHTMEKFNAEIYDIVSNPKNKGDVLVIYGLLQNVLKGQESLA